MIRIIFYFLIGYLLLTTLVYVFQRSLQYFPDKTRPQSPDKYALPGMQELHIAGEDGLQLLSWFMPPKNPDGKIIVFYHGNAGHIGHRAIKSRYYIERGYGVFFLEYRGYGGNKGSPSEQGFYADARSALKWLDGKGYKTSQIIIYGESIGTGVAVQIASEIQPEYLILEAPFSSAVDVARRNYFFLPVDILMKDRFDNIDKISNVKSSLLIVHGDEDRVIPIEFAKNLFERANHPKEFVTINGGAHNDLYEHHAGHIIRDWLDAKINPPAP